MCVYSAWILDYVKNSGILIFNEQGNAAVTESLRSRFSFLKIISKASHIHRKSKGGDLVLKLCALAAESAPSKRPCRPVP
jgi:hypothetical protein